MKRIIDLSTAKDLPFCTAIEIDDFLFISGMTSKDLATGRPLYGTIEEETERTIQNIKIVLEKAGYLGFDNIVKSTVYLADMSDFGKMNTIYSKYFSDNAIAIRSTVGVSLVGEYRIEIEIIAHK